MDTRSSSGCFTWRINAFSLMNQNKYYSDVFIIRGCKWRILIFPHGNNSEYFGIYLDVPDSATLPSGWARDATVSFTLVNQHNRSSSTKKVSRHLFKAREVDWGFLMFKLLKDLRDNKKGFLVNDILIIEVEVDVHDVVPPISVPPTSIHSTADVTEVARSPSSTIASTTITRATLSPSNLILSTTDATNSVTKADHFETFFSELEELIASVENSSSKTTPGTSRNNDEMFDLISGAPSLEEVEEAKQSLKECLSDLFKLNMKDRLAAAVLTLTQAETGLTSDQQKAIKAFRENFNEFISDFLRFEQENSEFELQKIARDQVFSAIKRNHESHISNKQLLESLNKEEEELKKRLEEIKSTKQTLMSDWEILMVESDETKSKYKSQEKKLGEAEEKKRIAEETMSRSSAAWSSLKKEFL